MRISLYRRFGEIISVQKRPTSIVFHPGNGNVLLADKTGDVYELNFETKCEDQKPILGHVSMLLSIAANKKFILSADRDEKIKVSLLDKPFVIHGYLLGVDFKIVSF